MWGHEGTVEGHGGVGTKRDSVGTGGRVKGHRSVGTERDNVGTRGVVEGHGEKFRDVRRA